MISSTECKKCPKGYLCKLYDDETQFIRCPLGKWTEEGGTECLPTPKGYMSASPAQEPMPCQDGYYTTSENSTYCTLCPRGYQCKNKDQEPEICKEGTYAGIGQTECKECPEEMYCVEGSSTPAVCPPNEPDCGLKEHFNPNGLQKRLLQSCASATYWDGTQCLTCPEGYRCAGGASNPVRCTSGTQYSSTGASGCSSCGAGYVCPTTRASDRYQCQAGFVLENGYCRPCAEGKYCPNGINEYSCTAGTNYSPGGLSACLSCPANKECHVYTYIDCTEGFYYTGGVCTECPTGSYCRNNVRTVCPAGEYMPYKGFTFCLQCPVQTRCATTGLSAYTACSTNSEWSAPGSTSCTSCELNYECFVGYSVPCKSNYYSAVGDFE